MTTIIGLLVLLATPAAGADLYEQIRLHNAKIEARLVDWSARSLLHADHIAISMHPTIVRWREQMVGLDFNDEISGLKRLNKMINSDIIYVDDYHHFHKTDYWADPETTLTEGGDCEDIALVKAATLHRFDWPTDRMHLLVGILTERGKKESHAVLMVETSDGEQLVLRSITDQVVHLSEFSFIPIYAVDRYGTLIIKSDDPLHLLHGKSSN